MAAKVSLDSSKKQSRLHDDDKARASVPSQEALGDGGTEQDLLQEALGDGEMEQQLLDADILLPSVLSFKKVQTSVKYPDKKLQWKRLSEIIEAENYDSFPAGEPNYLNIQSTPSSYPAKTYCDITGFATSYKDPRTNLRYANADIFKRVRSLSAEDVESYLAVKKAAVVLK